MDRVDFDDLECLSRTVWGEARGEGMEGKIAVAAVIMNRWRSGKWFAGRTVAGTCQKPYQFSAWNENDPNRDKLLSVGFDDPVFRDCIEAALRALAGSDPTFGATHYHADYVSPNWAEGKTPAVIIGRHKFYAGIS